MRRYIVILPFLFAAACSSSAPKQVSYAAPPPSATVATAGTVVLPGGSPSDHDEAAWGAFLPDPVPGGP